MCPLTSAAALLLQLLLLLLCLSSLLLSRTYCNADLAMTRNCMYQNQWLLCERLLRRRSSQRGSEQGACPKRSLVKQTSVHQHLESLSTYAWERRLLNRS
jgi:hypothetical protein